MPALAHPYKNELCDQISNSAQGNSLVSAQTLVSLSAKDDMQDHTTILKPTEKPIIIHIYIKKANLASISKKQ